MSPRLPLFLITDSGLRQNLINFEQRLAEVDPAYPINPLFDITRAPAPRGGCSST